MLHDNNVILSKVNKRVRLVSLEVSLGTYDNLQDWIINSARLRESRTICCANAHMVVEAKQKPYFAKAVNSADWIAPDGMPVAWAIRNFYSLTQERIAGMDLAVSLLQRAADNKISVFFYGATPKVLNQLCQKCRHLFPELTIAGSLAPPFRATTSEEDSDIIDQISNSGAGIVFVILGCPKQELWMSKMRGRIPAVMVGLGGAILVLAGFQNRAPRWMQDAGLEWFFRLIQEPRRLFKRYAITNSLFIWHLSRQWVYSIRQMIQPSIRSEVID